MNAVEGSFAGREQLQRLLHFLQRLTLAGQIAFKILLKLFLFWDFFFLFCVSFSFRNSVLVSLKFQLKLLLAMSNFYLQTMKQFAVALNQQLLTPRYFSK